MTPESHVLRSCIQWLHLNKVFHIRVNTGAYKSDNGNYIRYGAKGCPDIIAIVGGKFTGIECKSGKNKLSEHQEAFKAKILQNGGIYLIAYSVDDLEPLKVYLKQ